jgi:Skp family chaperone for outer membrane proteins
MKRELQSLKELSERMNLAKPGSEEYRELEGRHKQRAADLQVDVELKKRELTDLESKVYFDHYEKLQVVVNSVAAQRKIDFVFRFNSEEMKRDNRESILQGVNRALIFYPRTHDITPTVIAALNQS